ncbi:MAG: hypothetical protein ABIJ57_10900 [Pseudomonadota bacterium]
MADYYERIAKLQTSVGVNPLTQSEVLYTVPSMTMIIGKLFILNPSASTARAVSVSLSDADTPAASEFIMYGNSVAAVTTVEVPGICLQAGKRLTVHSNAVGAIFVLTGLRISGGA